MIRNYLKVAFRNIIRHRLFSLINIFGLSISIAACLLIILLIYGQKKVDGFHQKGNRIVRVLSTNENGPPMAGTPLPLGPELLETYPHLVEEMARIKSSFVGGDVVYGDKRIPLAGRYVDASFFKVFDFKLLGGNPKTALDAPFSIVLAKKAAEKLFGKEDPVGRSVRLNDIGLNTMGIDILESHKENMLGDFTVTGVVDTSPPSHIQFEFLISMSTVTVLAKQGKAEATFDDWKKYHGSYLYLVLGEGKTEKDLAPILATISQLKYDRAEDSNIDFSTQALSEVTLGKFVNMPISIRIPLEVFYFLSFLGLVVLFSACFNYVNLSFARSLARAKEVGVRKVIGAARRQLFVQFVVESIVISLVSLLLAVGILQLLSIMFQNLWINRFIELDFTPDLAVYGLFVLFSMLVGALAGVLPASFLSAFSPIKTIRNLSSMDLGFVKRFTLRKFLVVLQFCASLLFIISTLLLYFQMNHMLEAEYGFDHGNIINVKLQGADHAMVSNEFGQHPGINTISASSFVPGMPGYGSQTEVKTQKMSDQKLTCHYIGVDRNFIPNLKLQLDAGNNFPFSGPENKEHTVIVNRAAAQGMGYQHAEDIVGETIILGGGEQEKPVKVIGLVKNFYFDLLMESDIDEPLLLRYLPKEFAFINVRYDTTANLTAVLGFMEQKWNSLDRIHSFKYDIYDDGLKDTNSIFADLVYILGFISFLAISISCLGLLGIATFTAESRKKEIRIRKIHGAKIGNIALLLSNGFLRLFGLATVVTIPIAYLLNSIWLESFSYRIDFSPWILLLGVGLMFVLGSGTILSQTIKAATGNLMEGLREE